MHRNNNVMLTDVSISRHRESVPVLHKILICIRMTVWEKEHVMLTDVSISRHRESVPVLHKILICIRMTTI